MSFFIIGITEFNIEQSSHVSVFIQQMKAIAETSGYSLNINYRINDRFYGYALDPAYSQYVSNIRNCYEFELSDNGDNNSVDCGIADFDEDVKRSKNFNDIQLFNLFDDLWNLPFVRRMVIVFSYGLGTFDELHKEEVTLNEMMVRLFDLYNNFGMIDQNDMFILSKD